MFGSMTRAPRIAMFFIALVLIVFNLTTVTHPVLGFVGGVFLFAAAAPGLGRVLYPGQSFWAQTTVGLLGLVSACAIGGSAIYYLGTVTQESLVILVVAVALFAMLLGRHDTPLHEEALPNGKTAFPLLVSGLLIVTLVAWWNAFASITVVTSVRSVWDVVEPQSLIAILLSMILLGVLLSQKKGAMLTAPLTGTIFFSTIAVALVVFPLGYGFDPFIHRATVAHIAEFGTITPKPFYYIGQYALELIALHVFTLPLDLVDRILVPLLASVFLTGSAWIGLSRAFSGNHRIALLSLFLMPLGAFIVTTPQSLAYVFTAALLFLSLPRLLRQKQPTPLVTLGLLATAALVTHPLAGIPAGMYFIFVVIATATQRFAAFRTILLSLASLLGSVTLPLVFAWQSSKTNTPITVSLDHLFDVSKLSLSFFFANRFNPWLDLFYLAIDNMLWILAGLAIVGAVLVYKNNAVKTIHLPLLAAVLWFVNFWLLSTALEFDFLIEYERTNYATRLLTLTAIFLVPHVGFAFAGIHKWMSDKPRILFAGFVTFIAILVTANVYGAYPRHDNYARSAGFNVSKTDQDAVWSIDRAGAGDEYIVLANQAVSAAALEAFGFKRYYHGDIFYYPIPTGGALYDIYLIMTNDEPSRLHAQKAMDLAGVDTVFFVINEYWWQSEVIIEHAKTQADDWWAVGDGAVTIFVYERSGE